MHFDPSKRAVVEINLDAIGQNLAMIKNCTSSQILAVVKADAYGHGLVPIAKKALESGASYLGVALLEEAILLRKANITAPIIAWLNIPQDDFELAIKQNIELGVSHIETLIDIIDCGKRLQIKPKIHIEVDTGLTRGGFLDEWPALLNFLKNHIDHFTLQGLFTHFARAEEPLHPYNQEQITRFETYKQELYQIGLSPERLHLCNSGALLHYPDAHAHLIRAGISMYGLHPANRSMNESSIKFTQAMSVKAKVVSIKKVPKGVPVGYGGSSTTLFDTKLAVVCMGYADGIPRIADQRVGVTINGQKAPLIGRVSMDQMVVDLGPNSLAKPGDWAVIFGAGPSDYSVAEWAEASQTIPYEIMTRIASRIPRIYSNQLNI